MNLDNTAEVLSAYAQMDAEANVVQAKTGLHCPSGCGRCCDNPHIEATPLEMLPMAAELVHRGEHLAWLEEIKLGASSGVCVCYKPNPNIPGNGRCRMYDWRPSLCRLFGFAATHDKAGNPILAHCSHHKAVMPETLATVQAAVAKGLPIPQFAHWQAQVANIDLHWGYQRMPINQALQVALERVSLIAAYQSAVEPDPD
ncbi:MAG TPA: YkgJ family cysteine cluster protein [Leptolyngbyaceae cyanobacterium]